MHGAPKYTAADKHLDYANPDAPKGGAMTQAALGTFDTLNPFTIKGKAAEGLAMVYDRLMARVWDEPFTMYPLIAEGVTVADDRSAITFHINPKARFQDGSAITADDVLYSFETLRDFGRPNMRRVYKLVSAAEKTGPMTVKFSLGEGHDRETVMILAMMPVLSKAYWSGRNFDQTTLDIPVSSGPYKITVVEPGRRIVYQRDPDYWGKDLLVNAGHHNIDRITYDYFRDDTVAFEAFKAGNIMFRREHDGGRWAGGYDFRAIKDGRAKQDALPHGRPERTRGFIFNTRRPPFDDIRVRQALGLLFDFDWVNANIFHGQYRRIASYYPNSELAAAGAASPEELKILEPWRGQIPEAAFGPAWQPPAADSRANLREADRLLKEAGWQIVNGRRMKDGKPFSFEILLSAPEDEKVALHFKRALEKAGIRPTIRVLDNAAYIGRINEYDFDMTLYYWLSTLSPGTEQILYWGCEASRQHGRWNFAGICSPAVDSIAGAIANATSRDSLVAHVRALDRVLMAGHYMIPLYYSGKDYAAYWTPLRRPDQTPLYGLVVETWWMDPPAPAKQD